MIRPPAERDFAPGASPARVAFMLSTKSSTSTRLTSVTMPRPYWAAAPASCKSWPRWTLVPAPAGSSRALMSMAAWPRPFLSAPLALTTIVLVASSRSTISARPAKSMRTGPSAIVTVPSYSLGPTWRSRLAPGRHAATPGMSWKNAQVSSTDWGTSNVFSICMRALRDVRLGVLHKRRPTARTAEVVGGAPILVGPARLVGGHRHPADQIDGGLRLDHLETGSLRRRREEIATRPEADQFGEDRHRHLLVAGVAEVDADRRLDPGDCVVGHSPVGKVTLDRLGPPRRRDQAHEAGLGSHGRLDGLLVAVSLGGDHDDRGRSELVGVQFRGGNELRLPAEQTGHLDQGGRHRAVAHDDHLRRWQHGFDVHLHGALRLTRHGDDQHPLGHLAECVPGAEEDEPGLPVLERSPRLAEHHRFGASAADPAVDLTRRGDDGPGALMTRGRPLPPHHCRQGEHLALASHLRGQFEDFPGLGSCAHPSVLTGGAPLTSLPVLIAS